MHYILFIVLGFTTVTHAQDCKLIKETDPYTKEIKLTTGYITLEGAKLTIDANKQEIDCFFSISGADKCFTDASTAAIFFEGTKIKMTQRNNGSMNCEGSIHFLFKNNPTPAVFLQRISTQKITRIVFTGNNKTETEIRLTGEQQQIVMDLAACMYKEAPKLLQ